VSGLLICVYPAVDSFTTAEVRKRFLPFISKLNFTTYSSLGNSDTIFVVFCCYQCQSFYFVRSSSSSRTKLASSRIKLASSRIKLASSRIKPSSSRTKPASSLTSLLGRKGVIIHLICASTILYVNENVVSLLGMEEPVESNFTMEWVVIGMLLYELLLKHLLPMPISLPSLIIWLEYCVNQRHIT